MPGVIAKAADRPGADHVERSIDLRPSGIRQRIAARRPPAGGHAAEERHAVAGIGILLEERDQLQRLLGRRRAIVEAEAPDRQQRTPVVMEISRALGDAERRRPDTSSHASRRRPASPNDARRCRTSPRRRGRSLPAAERTWPATVSRKSRVASRSRPGVKRCRKTPGRSVLAKPPEVHVDRGAAIRRVQLGGPAVGHRQRRRAALGSAAAQRDPATCRPAASPRPPAARRGTSAPSAPASSRHRDTRTSPGSRT